MRAAHALRVPLRLLDALVRKDEDQIHELMDLITQEVSIVDRGANKRKFLLVKQKGGIRMPGEQEVTQDAKGNLVTNPSTGEPPDGVKKEGTAVSATLKQDAMTKLAEVLDRTMAIVKALRDLPDDADETSNAGFPPQLIQEISLVHDLVKAVADQHLAKADPPTTPAATEPAKTPAPGDVEKARTETQMFARMDKFLSSFSEMMKELREARTKADAPDPPPKVEKRDAPPSDPILQAMEKLSVGMQQIAEVTKANTDRLSALPTSNIPASNSVGVEKSQGSEPDGDDAVSWPLDMNNPVTRETVDKADWVA